MNIEFGQNHLKTVLGAIVLVIISLLLGRFWGTHSSKTITEPMSFVKCSPDQLGFSCAMHPQFRVTTAGKCLFCQMPLVREVVLPGQDISQVSMSKEAVALSEIETLVLEWSPAENRGLSLTGKVAVDHSRKFTQVASLPGRIEKLYAQRPGQWVKKGEPIARIYSRELISAVEAFRRPKTPESVRLSAHNNLRDWQVPEAIFDSLVKAEDHRQAVDIYAAASGMISELHAHVGEQAVNTIMGAPTTLYSLVDISVVWVNLNIYERDLKYITLGQSLQIRVDAFPGDTFRAKVISLSTEIDERSRTLTAIAEMANPRLKLRPGMLARATLPLTASDKKLRMIIPRSAVLWTGKRSVVYIRNPDAKQAIFYFREVVLGDVNEDRIEVISGLQAGEELVVNGAFSIDAAAQLQGKRSMMNMQREDIIE